MASSKRAPATHAGPKTPTSLHSSIVIADNASMTGTNLVTLGPNTVIHPRARINSLFGPVTVGSTCIVSERCQIGLQSPPLLEQKDGVVIEKGVLIEVGAVVEAKHIGEGSVIEINAKVGKGAVVGKVRLPK